MPRYDDDYRKEWDAKLRVNKITGDSHTHIGVWCCVGSGVVMIALIIWLIRLW